MTSVEIRRARPADVPDIRAVAERSWQRTYRDILSREEIRELLDSWYSEAALRSSVRGEGDSSALLVAEREDRCVGFGEWGDRGAGPEVFRLYVDPRHWRQGIGSRLLAALESEMRDAGVRAARLYVHRENDIGRSFWKEKGFGRFPEGDREDSPCELCMRKEFSAR